MNTRSYVSILLVAVFCFSFLSIHGVNSQSAIVTTTTTINQPSPGHCNEVTIAFFGKAGQEVAGTFGSDASVSFYVLAPSDLTAIQNPNCRLPQSSRPLYSETNVVGYDNPYRSLPFPADGTYYFVFVLANGGQSQLQSGFANIQLTYPSTTPLMTTQTSPTTVVTSSTQIANITSKQEVSSNTTSTPSAASAVPATGVSGAVGAIAGVAIIALALVFLKRRRPTRSPEQPQPTTLQESSAKEAVPEGAGPVSAPFEQSIPLGYPELDTVLAGGIPVKFAVLLSSPPCDERDLLLRKIVESTLAMDGEVFFLSRELGKMQDFATRYRKNFYILSPQADKIVPQTPNLFKTQTIQNLYDLNISFAKAFAGLPKNNSVKLIIIDFLSDILLEHRALTTRKWLDDFMAKRKAEGFTIIACLNPNLAPELETQAIVDLFDGIIDIYERPLKERTRRFLIVKKMYGRRYIETEVLLDKDRLF